MRVAAIQMNSGDSRMCRATWRLPTELLVWSRPRTAASFAVLPENFALMPEKGRDKARQLPKKKAMARSRHFLADAARRHGLWIVAGSMPLRSPEAERVYGGCPVYDTDGVQQAVYRKIHLFDVKLPDHEESYQESWSMYPGDEPVTVATPAGRIGLTICYDVRFPELSYRTLVDDGATFFTVPAAFTRVTGEAHWHDPAARPRDRKSGLRRRTRAIWRASGQPGDVLLDTR